MTNFNNLMELLDISDDFYLKQDEKKQLKGLCREYSTDVVEFVLTEIMGADNSETVEDLKEQLYMNYKGIYADNKDFFINYSNDEGLNDDTAININPDTFVNNLVNTDKMMVLSLCDDKKAYITI